MSFNTYSTEICDKEEIIHKDNKANEKIRDNLLKTYKDRLDSHQLQHHNFCSNGHCNGNLAKPRKKMPQINNEKHRTIFLQLLKEHQIEKTEELIDMSRVNAHPPTILPIQNEINIEKIEEICQKYIFLPTINPVIMVGSKQEDLLYILDGHHTVYANAACSCGDTRRSVWILSKPNVSPKELVDQVFTILHEEPTLFPSL
jgi:hypothetical protein